MDNLLFSDEALIEELGRWAAVWYCISASPAACAELARVQRRARAFARGRTVIGEHRQALRSSRRCDRLIELGLEAIARGEPALCGIYAGLATLSFESDRLLTLGDLVPPELRAASNF